MIARLPSLLVLVAAVACGASGVASAQDRPGECATRRVTGPGGAYRWDRVECQAPSGWSDFDRWGYDRRPLDVVDGPLRGDRYGHWSQPGREDGRGYDRQADDGRYAEAYPTYRVAGRDADGFLVWPGKLP
ncbi:hypothetical protein [Caulobacter soli]|uniref:hypothetical protein n=1 Tax=Caulobacter soli TaxID=2708539 RepID=UPI0013EC8FFF|nr:hypothetical protein [Caulobacter soli]